ncbi:STAS anti-anti-sigma factor RsbR-like protein (plasmid) [Alkalihalophilus pseudofirmus OF4]|uniref:STAS anti-anti-sigma factor RsbR-like protein n=1 Tax=Alkalihalophilus pseudofirmus (strain ATCC BAA-2126 / JCM 17055 / OF4) TaxID=398511 RepID=D3G1U9_ALKPO|nr:STAS domain-containing protein [Alkalihalophilus pseudofirmus]ADC52325.1 STAS anti-anti-sigma factor RsbR-like protein [Alkalihalophilus pseudofirmus OF4]
MNTQSLFELADQIILQASSIVEHALHLRSLEDPEYTERAAEQQTEAINTSADFVKLLGEGLKTQDDKFKINIIQWGKQVGEVAIKHGRSLEQVLSGTHFFRTAIWSFIEDQTKTKQLSAGQIFTITKSLDPLLDQAVYGFSQSYVENYRKISEVFTMALDELSVLNVPVFDCVALLPLVGDIDTNRAQMIINQTMQRATELEISKLILDLSGVSFGDTMVANHIFKLADGLSLLGVKTIITGISPAIAQTSVQLDIKLERLVTCATLKQALANIGYGLLQET